MMTETLSETSIQEQSSTDTKRPRSRWGVFLVWGGLILLLAVVGFSLYNSQRGRVRVGERAPDFSLTSFDGQAYTISELKGKVVLVNIWASWCVPCEKEAPFLEAAWKYFEPRGDVLFLGVDYTDTHKAAQAYIKRFGITYPNGPDLGTRIYDTYRATGVPETFIIDQNGILADFKYGEFTSTEEIIGAVERLLK